MQNLLLSTFFEEFFDDRNFDLPRDIVSSSLFTSVFVSVTNIGDIHTVYM
jgi:hypothetical protein